MWKYFYSFFMTFFLLAKLHFLNLKSRISYGIIRVQCLPGFITQIPPPPLTKLSWCSWNSNLKHLTFVCRNSTMNILLLRSIKLKALSPFTNHPMDTTFHSKTFNDLKKFILLPLRSILDWSWKNTARISLQALVLHWELEDAMMAFKEIS